MAGTKRPLTAATSNGNKRPKTKSSTANSSSKISSKAKPQRPEPQSSMSDESDSEGDFSDDTSMSDVSEDEGVEVPAKKAKTSTEEKTDAKAGEPTTGGEGFLKVSGSTSREAHAKQKAMAQERKAAKPNADIIAKSKSLWEKLRRKSHVPAEERKRLVAELFEIVTGRVHDFVFKHDSVRVIQTALKYGNLEQRKLIARELKGEYKNLAESRYAKFLVAKLMVHGDEEIRGLIIPEFYGSVKRLIKHPEASWILDDIYRTVATKEQKAFLLREWYGPEFVVFKDSKEAKPDANLAAILEAHPEKRGPIMHHLHEMTNQLIQKKTTGFTMLHDAMLQYFLNTKPGSAEFNEAIQVLLDDEEGDCLKNLAFTKSGAELVCLALAHATAKDRKLILRFYKGTVKILAGDQYGHMILLTAFDVIDDTVMTSKSIMPELLSKDMGEESRQQELLAQATDLTARIPLLYLFNPNNSQPKWLLSTYPRDASMLAQIHEIRQTTSKKDPEVRRKELVKSMLQPLLDLIASQSAALIESIIGTQFITEVLLGSSVGDDINRIPALESIVTVAKENPELFATPQGGRMLKSLVQSGKFDPKTKTISSLEPPLEFAELLFDAFDKEAIVEWATGPNSFVIVAMVERGSSFGREKELKDMLKAKDSKKKLKASAEGKGEEEKPNAGAKILIKSLGL